MSQIIGVSGRETQTKRQGETERAIDRARQRQRHLVLIQTLYISSLQMCSSSFPLPQLALRQRNTKQGHARLEPKKPWKPTHHLWQHTLIPTQTVLKSQYASFPSIPPHHANTRTRHTHNNVFVPLTWWGLRLLGNHLPWAPLGDRGVGMKPSSRRTGQPSPYSSIF